MKDLVNKSINANQIIGITTLTGKLFFYEDGFVFKSESVNGVINNPKIEYKTITSIKERNTLGIIPNGISIKKQDGEILNYVVFGRKDVIDFLKQKLASTNN